MLKKLVFKEEVKEILLKEIQKGKLKPGERISLPVVAEELEVSVTPIREALTQLAETGIVTYIPNRGFFVSELSTTEAKDIYDLLGVLEAEALSKIPYTKTQIKELRRINTAFKNAKGAREMLGFDRLFHEKLVEGYTNVYAREIIEQLHIQIALYDYAFWDTTQQAGSHQLHAKIIAALEAKDLQSAALYLRQNWGSGIPFVNEHFEKKQNHLKSTP